MMTTPDFFETDVRDEPQHWEALAERVIGAATRSRQTGFAWLSTSRAAWVAATVLTGIVLTVLMMVTNNAQADLQTSWATMLAPSDDFGRAVVMRADPPPVGALLFDGRTR